MSISATTFVVTVLFFCTAIYLILLWTKRPKNKVPDYMKMDELEQTGWELVEDIKNASETYADQIQGVKKEIEHKLEELQTLESRFKQYRNYEEILSQKQEVLEELFEKMKTELAHLREEKEEQQTQFEEMKQMLLTPPPHMDRVKEKVDAMIEEEKNRAYDRSQSNPIEAKKSEIYRLYDQGLSVSAIAEETGTEKGFIEVLINLQKYNNRKVQ